MEPSEMINLCWEDFGPNTRDALKELREEREFLDVTLLAGDGKRVHASKVVLAAGSSFFFKILCENPHPHPLIYLKGVNYKHLLAVSDFLYTGEVSIPEEDLKQFLDIAEDLKIKGLIPTKTKSSRTTPAPHQNQGAIEKSAPLPMETHPHSEISPPSPYSSHPHSEISPPSPYSLHPHSARSLPLQGGQVIAKEPGMSHGTSRSHSALSSPQDPVAIEETAPPPWIPHPSEAMYHPQGRVTKEEPAPVPRLSYYSLASSHVLNTVPQKDHVGTCDIKVEVGDASHYDVSYGVKEGTLDSSSDMIISEATDSVFENKQIIHDWYGQDEENSMALAGEQDENTELDIRKFGEKEETVDSNGDIVVTESLESEFINEQSTHGLLESEFINEQSTHGRYEEVKGNDIMLDGEQNPNDKIGSSGKYQCDQCSKTFSVSNIFHLHLKIHALKKKNKYSSKR